MKLFIARGVADSVEDFGEFLASLKKRKNLQVYLIGEKSYEWKTVHDNDLDGLVKTPPELKPLITREK